MDDITEATHVRVFVEAGNGSYVRYRRKDEPLGRWEYVLTWRAPGAPNWWYADDPGLPNLPF